jgi:hypothetical protein
MAFLGLGRVPGIPLRDARYGGQNDDPIPLEGGVMDDRDRLAEFLTRYGARPRTNTWRSTIGASRTTTYCPSPTVELGPTR